MTSSDRIHHLRLLRHSDPLPYADIARGFSRIGSRHKTWLFSLRDFSLYRRDEVWVPEATKTDPAAVGSDLRPLGSSTAMTMRGHYAQFRLGPASRLPGSRWRDRTHFPRILSNASDNQIQLT